MLRPVAAVYGAAMRLRACRYQSRYLTTPYRPACPVISVGNISWGGTGKTPIVEYILTKAAKSGLQTVVLTRGYKATPLHLPFPVRPDSDPRTSGDEPLLLAQRHPETLVLVDPKRARAAAWAESNIAPELFLLDDGMQHLAIERDLDIVLLAPGDLLDGWNRVIPAGSWREDKTALARADAFCMKVDGAVLSDIAPAAEKLLGGYNRPLYFFDLQPTGLTRLMPHGKTQAETTPDLAGSPYFLLCGTGNPAHVQQTAKKLLGRDPADCLIMQDHHHYTETDINAVRQRGYPIVCTAKDAVKLAPLLPLFDNIPVWILNVRTVFTTTMFTDTPFDIWLTTTLQHLCSGSAPS